MANLGYLQELSEGTTGATQPTLASTQPVATAPQTFGSGATTLGQPVTQTAETNLSPNMIDVGFRDSANNGIQYVPDRIRISDLTYNPYSETENGDQTNYNFSSLGFGTNRDQYGNWGSEGNPYSDNWNISYEGWDPRGTTAWNPDQGLQFKVKSGDKYGSVIKYKRDGDWLVADPTSRGKEHWDTNDAKKNMDMLKVAMTAMSMGMAGPALAGLGSALQAGTMPTLAQLGTGLSFANMGSGGMIPGLSQIGGLVGGASGLANGISSGINGIGDVANLAKSGYNVYSKGSQLMDMFSGPDEQQAYGGTTGGGTAPTSNLMPSGGGFDLGSIINMVSGGAGGGNTGLADLWGAWEGSRQAKDASGNFKQMYSDAQARRQPYLDRLNESYVNPNSFYDTSQWKGLSDVYKNSIDRTAASKGRNANPTDREVLLNNYALKELENYRGGLRSNAQMLNPDQYINPNMRGLNLEMGANNPFGAMIGRGSVGGPGLQQGASGLQQLITQLLGKGGSSAMGTAPDIVKAVQGFLGGGGGGPGGVGMGGYSSGGDMDSPYNPFTGYNEPVYGGDTYGDGPTNWGAPSVDPDWGFNADGGNGFSYGDFDVEDTGWLDDVGSWFDW